MPYSDLKPWYARIDWPLWLLVVVPVGLLVFVLGLTRAFAGGPVGLTWDQGQDCAVVTGWELLQAPVTAAQPNPQPSAAPVGVSIPNTGTPPCGLAMTKSVTLNGIGPYRFWLRAVAAAGKSGPSNAVDTPLPFAAPSSLSVVVQ